MAVLASSWFFYVFPGVDLSVSGWFYDATEGFALAKNPLLRALRSSATWIMRVVVLLALFQIARHSWAGRMAGHAARRSLWLLSCLVVGPGLLVSGLLKEYWERPRPIATDLFRGEVRNNPATSASVRPGRVPTSHRTTATRPSQPWRPRSGEDRSNP